MKQKAGIGMENHYFFTGFPGFICNQLILEVLKKAGGDCSIYALTLPSMTEKARGEADKLSAAAGFNRENFHLVEGDITKPGLGMPHTFKELYEAKLTHIFHLAAVYDLAVPRTLAYKVNVEGTQNVNDWVKSLPSLKRYIYFSTAYVAGKREGMLYENELIRPSDFKNHYEETKFEAEVLVESLKGDFPITIIRPGIVKGHSVTGETIKFDGPYFILNFLDRLRFLPVIPRLGRSSAVINLVPIDYIIKATSFLSHSEKSSGKTYHLTDPNPYPVEELYAILMKELVGKEPKGTLPLPLARFSLSIPPIQKFLGVEKEALDYFTWKGRFDCAIAQEDLKDSGISCPDFREGVPGMVKFFLQHKHDPAYQIKII